MRKLYTFSVVNNQMLVTLHTIDTCIKRMSDQCGKCMVWPPILYWSIIVNYTVLLNHIHNYHKHWGGQIPKIFSMPLLHYTMLCLLKLHLIIIIYFFVSVVKQHLSMSKRLANQIKKGGVYHSQKLGMNDIGMTF